MKVYLTGWDGKKVGSVVSKVVSGADFAAQHITSPHHASHPMRVILDLDEKSGGWVRIFFLPRRFFCVSFVSHSSESESEFGSSHFGSSANERFVYFGPLRVSLKPPG